MASSNQLFLPLTLVIAIASQIVLTNSLVVINADQSKNETIYRTGSMSIQIDSNFNDTGSDRLVASLYGKFKFMMPAKLEEPTNEINKQEHVERKIVFKLIGFDVNRDDKTGEPDVVADMDGLVHLYYYPNNGTSAA